MHEAPGYSGSKIHPEKLVGVFFTNPVETYVGQNGKLPQFLGMKVKNIWKSPLWEINMDLIRKLQQFSH